ncbi:uncharacterized protein [Chelonus insularis]|uniref:uncharacterized protein n=1 Tax=Chelonus insularis TaxID=460826 RepID=UPI00158A940E|nr:uncharacterized protein LOC118069254 [Chelonus insularis]
MLKKSRCFIIFIRIYYHLLTSCVAGNQYPDVIATFRGPFQDPLMPLQDEKFYEEKISCDLMMEPMETIRTALNQLEVLRRSYCNNPGVSEREPINLPILPTGSRNLGTLDSAKKDDNKGIDFLGTNEDYAIKTTENPNVLSTTMEDNTSSTRQKTFFKRPKKKCPPKKMTQSRTGRKSVPYTFYEFYDDHENHDEYYENVYYYNGIKK